MISEGYVSNGATVYITARDFPACEKAVAELNALGKGKAVAIRADFYKEEDCKRLFEEFSKREDSMYDWHPYCEWFEAESANLYRTPCPRQQCRVQLGCPI
jgi:hypothetical protein